MAEALALTLQSGNVDCQVSSNILQQQWERMMGPIAFHPLSVLTETPDLSALVEIPGMKSLIDSLLDELLLIAHAQGCSFPRDFKQRTIESTSRMAIQSTMYQDFASRRPMEVEVFLGSPIKMAKSASITAPQLQTLYPLLCHLNTINQLKLPGVHLSGARDRQSIGFEGPSPVLPNGTKSSLVPMTETNSSSLATRPISNQKGIHHSKRPPSSLNGRGISNGDPGKPHSNGNGNYGSRRNSFDNDLEEFGHIVMYGDMLHTDDTDDLVLAGSEDRSPAVHDSHHRPNHLSIREREFQLRQRELALKEQELALQRNSRPGNRRKGPRSSNYDYEDDDDDDDEYFNQSHGGPGSGSYINPDNIDMMSVTSRRNRRLPNTNSLRGNFSSNQAHRMSYHGASGSARGRNKDRASTTLISDFPTPHSSLADDPLLNYSSNRYPTLQSSRANSLTTSRLDEYTGSGGSSGHPPLPSRRASATPPYNSGFPPISSTASKPIHKLNSSHN
ncbi:hypothetical protein TWF694_002198 [Orbilia ellipsospora]